MVFFNFFFFFNSIEVIIDNKYHTKQNKTEQKKMPSRIIHEWYLKNVINEKTCQEKTNCVWNNPEEKKNSIYNIIKIHLNLIKSNVDQ